MRRAWRAPEVVQTSAMDCGPAALKCLLDGHGLPVSYGRLREACQTDLDGTSVDTLEQVAQALGLQAEQVLVPADQVQLAGVDDGPSLAVVRQAGAATHFVVVWRRVGRWVQVMDPASGRHWMSLTQLRRQLYRHTAEVAADDWRAWAASDEARRAREHGLEALGLSAADQQVLQRAALADAGWYSLAALEACQRMTQALADAGGVRRGREAASLLRGAFERCVDAEGRTQPERWVPERYWSVRATATTGRIQVSGAVQVRVRGRSPAGRGATATSRLPDTAAAMRPELRAALTEPSPTVWATVWQLLRQAGGVAPLAWCLALAATTTTLALQLLLLRGLFDLASPLVGSGQRWAAAAALLAFLALLPALELPLARGSLRLGRQLELRLRLALWRQLPRLHDRYFQSRPISDMADRAHGIHAARGVPATALALGQAVLDLGLTTAGLLWLAPGSAAWALALAAVAIVVPVLWMPAMAEHDLRVRTHGAALAGFYLDALLGLVPVRAHRAERAVQREHEALRVEWSRALRGWTRSATLGEGVLGLLCIGCAAALLFDHFGASRPVLGSDLLLVFWTLKLPALGQRIAALGQTLPAQRNALMRLMEPLSAPVSAEPASPASPASPAPVVAAAAAAARDAAVAPPALGFELSGGSVRAGGHEILRELTLAVRAGEHVALVGVSGAGKSSLLGLLLGWHRLADGHLSLDGQRLPPDAAAARIEALRPHVAWVDPAVQLWNRSLLDNLLYACDDDALGRLDEALTQADLLGLAGRLPQGLQSLLGEGGSLLSGGEGQRVRLARALLQPSPRLVLLDEPFRGLDRARRARLLRDACQWWHGRTLLCVTHDVAETQAFARVLVVQDGRIVEDDNPAALMARASRYRQLVQAEIAVQQRQWADGRWRQLRLADGDLVEGTAGAVGPRGAGAALDARAATGAP